MRICFLCNEYPPGVHGGIGVFTRVLAHALVRAGHEVRVVGAYVSGEQGPAYAEDGGVRIWRLPIGRGALGWVAARYRLFRQMAAWARGGEIDILECPDYEGWVAGWPPLPIPVVVRLHGSVSYFAQEMGGTRSAPIFWLEEAALRRADALCSTSHYTARRTARIFGLGERRMAVLFNSVEMPPAVAADRHSQRVIFSGTLAAKKGIQSLIEAWPRVNRAVPGAELHVFGKDARSPAGGSMLAALRARLNGSGSSVQFHGHVQRQVLLEALASAGVAVFPSLAEAFALAPLEAMACGCATVYSRRGSGPELIRDGQDGLLVDPEDPGEIAAAVIRLLADRDLAARIGTSGRERVRAQFSAEGLAVKNVEFYRASIEEFRR